jgi:acetaldehyde dehydrogenase
MIAAVSRVAKVHYGEIVASIASKSAGPGTRANIDEFTETTAHAIEKVGGATKGKAIIVLNPAEPPLVMRDTVFTLSEMADKQAIVDSINLMVAEVQKYVPGYQLHQEVQFEEISAENPVFIEGLGKVHGLKTMVLLQVRGAGHYLPEYAGNLDIMTSAALATAERMAETMIQSSSI